MTASEAVATKTDAQPWTTQESLYWSSALEAAQLAGDPDTAAKLKAQIASRPTIGLPTPQPKS
jgi:hypothetical protein